MEFSTKLLNSCITDGIPLSICCFWILLSVETCSLPILFLINSCETLSWRSACSGLCSELAEVLVLGLEISPFSETEFPTFASTIFNFSVHIEASSFMDNCSIFKGSTTLMSNSEMEILLQSFLRFSE